jgi:hypothetical protein
VCAGAVKGLRDARCGRCEGHSSAVTREVIIAAVTAGGSAGAAMGAVILAAVAAGFA